MLSPGKDLIGVQNLLKKHQALQAEITGHEPRIKAVTQKGEAMVEEGRHTYSAVTSGSVMLTATHVKMRLLCVCSQGTLLVRM